MTFYFIFIVQEIITRTLINCLCTFYKSYHGQYMIHELLMTDNSNQEVKLKVFYDHFI